MCASPTPPPGSSSPAPVPQGNPPPPGGPAGRDWVQPAPYGLTQARQSMSGGAAALLAGFSIALIGVIAQAPSSIRWPGASLLLLTIAAALLVACVQCGFWARTYLYSRAEIEEWRPQPWDDWETQGLLREQKSDETLGSGWEDAAEWTYHLGLVALAVGVGLTLAPPEAAQQGEVRWAAACVAFASALIQGGWGIVGWFISSRRTP
jgi:hypothetical protein